MALSSGMDEHMVRFSHTSVERNAHGMDERMVRFSHTSVEQNAHGMDERVYIEGPLSVYRVYTGFIHRMRSRSFVQDHPTHTIPHGDF